MACRS